MGGYQDVANQPKSIHACTRYPDRICIEMLPDTAVRPCNKCVIDRIWAKEINDVTNNVD